MIAPVSVTLLSRDDGCTQRLGAALARTLPTPPDRSLRIFLRGELGAGKTTFVRGMLQALGETRTIKSPTYGILETYELDPWHVVHLDLYRVSDPRDLGPLGLADHDHAQALWLIEWPERGERALPQADVEIFLDGANSGHSLRFEGRTQIGTEWVLRVSREPEFSAAER